MTQRTVEDHDLVKQILYETNSQNQAIFNDEKHDPVQRLNYKQQLNRVILVIYLYCVK